jgi:hypothetical protein
MASYLLAFLLAVAAGWSIAACEALFRSEDRPGIFQGTVGMVLLLLASCAGGLLVAGGAVWALHAVKSSAVWVVLLGGGWLGIAASQHLHVTAAGAANRLYVGLAGLAALYGIAWSYLPPA